MKILLETLHYFVFITLELVALFIIISSLVKLLLMYIPQDKIQKKLSGKGIRGNIIAAIFGSLTPFCACSTIPLTVGFLQAGVSFGSVMSFLIASPLLNPIVIGMLVALLGVKAAVIYFAIAFVCAIAFGFILERMGGANYVKKLRANPTCCNAVDSLGDKRTISFFQKLKLAFTEGCRSLKPIIGYLLVGVALGAGIYGYLPAEFVLRVAGNDNLFAVPLSAILGIPLYIRAETAIPIGLALMGKGMSVGAVIALIIGGAGMAIPEMMLLASIFKKRLVLMIIITIFLTSVMGGYLFNFLM